MTYRFNVADLSSIETRVGAWIAGCRPLMEVFEKGRDSYLDFASRMYGLLYEKLKADYDGLNGKEKKIAAKLMRQIAKPGVLGAIYRLSGGGWGFDPKGYIDHVDSCDKKRGCDCPMVYDKIKTGLWGYADNMGVEMSLEQAHMVVRMFREAYPEIVQMWKILEDAVADVLRGTNTVRKVGPNGCVVIDKMNIRDGDDERCLLRIQLPSGRYLHYMDARLENCKMPWKDSEGNDVYREALVYAGQNQKTSQWDIWVQSHGGKLFENIVQGIARDILAVKLLDFEANELPVVGHVHDEGICMVVDDPFSPTVKDMVRMMSTPVDWAPGLLLGADGFEGSFYHK